MGLNPDEKKKIRRWIKRRNETKWNETSGKEKKRKEKKDLGWDDQDQRMIWIERGDIYWKKEMISDE